jgi:hypothetical protein
MLWYTTKSKKKVKSQNLENSETFPKKFWQFLLKISQTYLSRSKTLSSSKTVERRCPTNQEAFGRLKTKFRKPSEGSNRPHKQAGILLGKGLMKEGRGRGMRLEDWRGLEEAGGLRRLEA